MSNKLSDLIKDFDEELAKSDSDSQVVKSKDVSKKDTENDEDKDKNKESDKDDKDSDKDKDDKGKSDDEGKDTKKSDEAKDEEDTEKADGTPAGVNRLPNNFLSLIQADGTPAGVKDSTDTVDPKDNPTGEAEKVSDKEKDKAAKTEPNKTDGKESAKKSDEPTEDEESVIKSEDVVSAFEAIFKGMTSLASQQNAINERVGTLIDNQEKLEKSIDDANRLEEIKKSSQALEKGLEEAEKSAKAVEGKAVNYVEKNYNPGEDAQADEETDVEPEQQEDVQKSTESFNSYEKADELRKSFLPRYIEETRKSNFSRDELNNISAHWNNLSYGKGTSDDEQIIKSFIEGK